MPKNCDEDFRTMNAFIDEVHYDKKDGKCKLLNNKPLSNQIHIMLKPVDKDWKRQHWFIYDSRYKNSSCWKIVQQFNKLGIIDLDELPEGNEDIFQYIYEQANDAVFHFEERMIGKSKRKNWFPVKKL